MKLETGARAIHITFLASIKTILENNEFPDNWFFDYGSSRCVMNVDDNIVVELIRNPIVSDTKFSLRLNRVVSNNLDGKPFDYVDITTKPSEDLANEVYGLFLKKYEALIP